jgi:signal transduction histidine kinase
VFEPLTATDDTPRLSRLADYNIMGSQPDTMFDRIARLACRALDAPIGAIGLLDSARTWFKASVGLDVASVPNGDGFCARLLGQTEPLIITDTLADPACRDVAVVHNPPYVRFYAGVPLRAPDGLHIGALIVLDSKPHAMPTPNQIAILCDLAAMVVEEMELRRVSVPGAETMDVVVRRVPRAESAHRNLLAAYAAKSEFLSSLSHELRTPLNAIVGYAGLIAGSDDTPPSTAEHAGEITDAARHMLALVSDILEYSRLEAGSLPIGWQRVVVRPVLQASLRMVSVFATSRGIRLVEDFAWPGAVMRGDPVRMKQVMLNLLTNAIKFTPRGGTVSIRLAKSAADTLEIVVTDTGCGIAEADIAKTLTPFGQIVPKEGAQTEGTGLGLPIAKALVERHGGSLRLTSRLGAGTAVQVTLPALPEIQAAESRVPVTAP